MESQWNGHRATAITMSKHLAEWDNENVNQDSPSDHAIGAFNGISSTQELGQERRLSQSSGQDIGGISVDEASQAGKSNGLESSV